MYTCRVSASHRWLCSTHFTSLRRVFQPCFLRALESPLPTRLSCRTDPCSCRSSAQHGILRPALRACHYAPNYVRTAPGRRAAPGPAATSRRSASRLASRPRWLGSACLPFAVTASVTAASWEQRHVTSSRLALAGPSGAPARSPLLCGLETGPRGS